MAVAGIFVALFPAVSPADEASRVGLVLEKAQIYLLSQERGGNWEVVPSPTGQRWEESGGQWGGRTALVTYALLANGVSPRDAHIQSAIHFLKGAQLRGVYAIGLRSLVWNLLKHEVIPARPGELPLRQCILRDRDLLLYGMKKGGGGADGMFDYLADGTPAGRYDHSASQYGVLGLWACEEAGAEISDTNWLRIGNAWRRDQLSDGAWAYQQVPGNGHLESVTFTAAGIASLFISDDYLQGGFDPEAQRGVQWLSDHFGGVFNSQSDRLCYALYGVERAALASGMKNFGGVDWYETGMRRLVGMQRADGSWDCGDGPVADTAFATLFLVRGRQPVVMNKLDYRADPSDQQWNRRPRDVAHFAHWMSAVIEAKNDLLWQVVTPAANWNDSRLLYICGDGPFTLDAATGAKLKEFVDRGGLVLCSADGGSAAFCASVENLGARLFGRSFRALPADHPIFCDEAFPSARWRQLPRVLGVSNGDRELMLLVPDADLSYAWQTRSDIRRRMQYELAADVVLYASGRESLADSNETAVAAPLPDRHPPRTIRIARLRYDGAWDPEPGGWEELAAKMHNDNVADLQVDAVVLGAGQLNAAKYPVAHLTGNAPFQWTAAQRQELSHYVASGGTLIVDAAGGSSDFAASAKAQLQATFHSPLIAADSAMFSRMWPPVRYTLFARQNNRAATGLQIQAMRIGGREAVFFSDEDLSAGLLGQPVDGIIGYDPPTAIALMERMILYGAGGMQ